MRRAYLATAALLLMAAALLLRSQTAVIGPVPAVVAKVDSSGLTANISATTFYTVPSGQAGTYRMMCYEITTQAASSSSTLPQCAVYWTDADTNVGNSAAITVAVTSNGVGVSSAEGTGSGYMPGGSVFNARAGTVIQYGSINYASSGASVLTYNIHVKLEYLGQ